MEPWLFETKEFDVNMDKKDAYERVGRGELIGV